MNELKILYGISCRESDIVDLRSNHKEKFSSHLIFDLPGTAFQDNLHVGKDESLCDSHAENVMNCTVYVASGVFIPRISRGEYS
jgi:hypothetical protein